MACPLTTFLTCRHGEGGMTAVIRFISIGNMEVTQTDTVTGFLPQDRQVFCKTCVYMCVFYVVYRPVCTRVIISADQSVSCCVCVYVCVRAPACTHAYVFACLYTYILSLLSCSYHCCSCCCCWHIPLICFLHIPLLLCVCVYVCVCVCARARAMFFFFFFHCTKCYSR